MLTAIVFSFVSAAGSPSGSSRRRHTRLRAIHLLLAFPVLVQKIEFFFILTESNHLPFLPSCQPFTTLPAAFPLALPSQASAATGLRPSRTVSGGWRALAGRLKNCRHPPYRSETGRRHSQSVGERTQSGLEATGGLPAGRRLHAGQLKARRHPPDRLKPAQRARRVVKPLGRFFPQRFDRMHFGVKTIFTPKV